MDSQGEKVVKKNKRTNTCPKWVVESLVLVHYGSDTYDPAIFRRIENRRWVKPKGGLWTSPVSSGYGWIHFCESEMFNLDRLEKFFFLKFRSDAKILVIDSLEDLLSLPMFQKGEGFFSNLYLDFEGISKKFDAIWLTENGQWATRLSHPINLYGWDVETVLVMNPDSVYEMEKSKKTIKKPKPENEENDNS